MKQENGKLPEIGDVWRNKKYNTLFLFLSVLNQYSNYACGVIKTPDGGIDTIEIEYNSFLKEYEYLGKAKHPLSTIFEVE